MATTTKEYTGDGSKGIQGQTQLTFNFPYLKTEEVKVSLNGKTLETTKYTFPTATSIQFEPITGTATTFESNTQELTGAPKTGVKIVFYRDTDVDTAKSVFAAGSSFRARDLNDNQDQLLFKLQERINSVNNEQAGSTAPTSPVNGDRWYDTISGRTYVYYKDSDSSQWVEANPPFDATDLATESSFINFQQAGTANTRTVETKLQDFVSVKDFGAKGDGTTDDTTAFQNAINTGKPVYVPKATYKITDTLTLNAGYRSLIGDEAMPVIEMHTDNKSAIAITEPSSGLNEYSRVENLYIQRKVGGSFTCPNYNATLTETLAGVVVSGHGSSTAAAVQSARISNLRVGNFAVGFYFADCVGVTVHKCFTQNLGTYTSATQTANGTTITSSMFGVGFYFDATRFGSGSISPLASIEIVETDDNRTGDPTTIKSVSYLAIGQDIRDIFFERAESTSADFGWYIDGQTNDDLNWDIHIIRPIIDAFKTNGIFATNIDGAGALSITGGYFVGAADASACIYVTNSNGVAVTGGAQLLGLSNNSSSNTDDGVRLDNCSSCLVVGNRFANLQYGISLNGTSYTTVQGNVISAAATEDEGTPTLHEAIRLFNTSTRNTIMGNTIRGKDTSGAAQYSHGINIAASADDKNVVIGNVIDPDTVASEITDASSNSIKANNITS